MRPLHVEHIPQQELFLVLFGNGGFDWTSIQMMTVAERMYYVKSVQKYLEEKEKAQRDAEMRAAVQPRR